MSETLPDSLAPARAVQVTRISADGVARTTDMAATEEPLDVRLHGRSFAIIMRTPGQDRELAAGFLMSERVIRSGDDVGAVEHCRHPDQTRAHHVVDVFLRADAAARVPGLLAQRRDLIANSSCGVCGRATIDELSADIEPLRDDRTVPLDVVRALPERLRGTQRTFEETGGLHGAALFDVEGQLIGSAEDVGRHNAVDKVFGALLLADAPPHPAVLVVSGRVSFEIVQKAWIARVPILVAISAPTTLAVTLADEAGVTLLGFVRDAGLNIYSHPARISGV